MDYKKCKQTHNTKIYGFLVGTKVDDTHDYYWLCNKLAWLYKRVESDGCVDRLRASKSIRGKWDKDFQIVYENGCCGSTNLEVTNDKTGNSFWIGFNYGH